MNEGIGVLYYHNSSLIIQAYSMKQVPVCVPYAFIRFTLVSFPHDDGVVRVDFFCDAR